MSRPSSFCGLSARGIPICPWLPLTLLFLLGVAVRSAFLSWTGAFGSPELFEYEEAARNLLAGRGMVVRMFGLDYYSVLHPIFPFSLAILYKLFGHHYEVAQVFQIVISACIGPVIFFVVRSYLSLPVAGLAGALAATHPGLVALSTLKIHSESVDSLLLVVASGAGAAALRCWSTWRALLFGVAVGVAMLARGTYAPLLVAFGLLALRVRGRQGVTASLLAALVASLVVAPWVGRNYMIHGRPIFMISTTGYALWIGYNPGAMGGALGRTGQSILEEASPELKAQLHKETTELGQMGLFHREASRFIQAHPFESAGLFLRRLVYYWSFAPLAGMNYPRRWFHMYAIYYGIAFALAAVGMVWMLAYGKQHRTFALFLLLSFVGLSIAQSFFYVEGRHRWEVEPLFLIFTAAGVARLRYGVARRLGRSFHETTTSEPDAAPPRRRRAAR